VRVPCSCRAQLQDIPALHMSTVIHARHCVPLEEAGASDATHTEAVQDQLLLVGQLPAAHASLMAHDQ